MVKSEVSDSSLNKVLPEPKPVLFSPDITFDCEYISDGIHMPYALFSPSGAESADNIPLIVFLHGTGGCNVEEEQFMNSGLVNIMVKWSQLGFNAYVICPQLYGPWNSKVWNSDLATNNVIDLLDFFVSEHNIDVSRIFLVGFSLGALGAMHMAHECPDYFSKTVVISSPNRCCSRFTEIAIPIIGYSETETSYNQFMIYTFPQFFGDNTIQYYNVSHGELPFVVFNEDLDKNHRSDLVEWLLDIQ